MKSLDIAFVITPTLTLPPQRGRAIPGFPDGDQVEVFPDVTAIQVGIATGPLPAFLPAERG